MNAGAERGEFVSLIVPILEPMASALEFFGVAVIIIGVAVATLIYLKDVFVVFDENAYTRYRKSRSRHSAWP